MVIIYFKTEKMYKTIYEKRCIKLYINIILYLFLQSIPVSSCPLTSPRQVRGLHDVYAIIVSLMC